jgi:uncharacterized protein (DUF1499 family)
MAQPNPAHSAARKPVTPIATAGLVLAVLAALAAAASGLGHRLGLWTFGTGFGVLRYAVYVGIAAVAVSLLGVVLARPGGPRRGLWRAIAGLVIAGVVLAIPLNGVRVARQVPPIHDITTDLEDPPAFVAVVQLRGEGSNPVAYGGEEIAAQQRAGYPEIAPLDVDLPPERLFEQALATAEEMGWQIVAAEPADGRIEATDTTFWFGFKDDVVIRIQPAGGGSRLDVRSVSRVGRSDVGANAARIKAYLAALGL